MILRKLAGWKIKYINHFEITPSLSTILFHDKTPSLRCFSFRCPRFQFAVASSVLCFFLLFSILFLFFFFFFAATLVGENNRKTKKIPYGTSSQFKTWFSSLSSLSLPRLFFLSFFFSLRYICLFVSDALLIPYRFHSMRESSDGWFMLVQY